MALTDIKVRTAKPTDKQYKLTDGSGMHLLVHPNGSKYWRLQYRFDGKQKMLALGVYPEITLADARAPLSVNAIRNSARWCSVLTIISALSAALTCATTMRRLLWKLPISDGSSTMALVKYLTAWRCAQSIIKRLIVVRLVWMKICV